MSSPFLLSELIYLSHFAFGYPVYYYLDTHIFWTLSIGCVSKDCPFLKHKIYKYFSLSHPVMLLRIKYSHSSRFIWCLYSWPLYIRNIFSYIIHDFFHIHVSSIYWYIHILSASLYVFKYNVDYTVEIKNLSRLLLCCMQKFCRHSYLLVLYILVVL